MDRSFDKSLPNLKKPIRALPQNVENFKPFMKSTDFSNPSPNNFPQLKGRLTPLSNPASREKHHSSILGNNTSLLTEVERDISSMDVNARMRDLENKFLDFKTNFEKRVLIMLEENPQKYIRHLKVMEDKDSALWKDSFQKQSKLEDDFQGLRDTLHNQNEAFFNKILTLEAQVQNCEFKMRSTPQNNHNNIDSNLLAIDSKEYNGNLMVYDKKASSKEFQNTNNQVEIELKLVKEGLFQEQNRRDTLYKDVMGLYKDLNNMVHKHENELLHRFKQQKDEISLETNASKEQIKKIEALKTETMNTENSLMKNMINSLEKRVNEEVDRRMVLEYEIKRLVDDKMNGFKDENVRNEKNFLENEHKSMKQIHESFVSLNQIIKSNKDQLEADLASTQTMTNENFKTLSKTIDFLRETLGGKLLIIDNAIKDQSLTLNGVVADNNKKIEDFHIGITKELERNEKIIGVFELELGKIIKETDGKIDIQRKGLDEWKKNYEVKTQTILKEMNSLMKGLKEDMLIEKNDKNDKMKQLMKEQEAYAKMHEDLLSNMKTKMNNLNESWEYKLKEMSINFQALNSLNDQKLKDSIEEVKRVCNEHMEKNIVENIYNLNQKITSEYKKEIETNQEKNKTLIEENREKILNDLAYNDKKNEGLVNKLREEFSHKNNTNIKQIQENAENLRSFKEENKENLRKVAMNIEQENQKLENIFDNKIKSNALDLKEDFSKSLNQNSKDFKSDLIKNSQEATLQLKALEQQIQREFENRGSNLTNNFMEELLKESTRINEKFKSFEQIIDTNKRMTLEAVSQTNESTRALCRALINEESAKREKSLDDLLKLMKQTLDALEKLLSNKMDKLSEELHIALKNRTDELEQVLMQMEKKLLKEMNELKNSNEKGLTEICTEIYLEKLLRKQRECEYDETMKNIEVRFMYFGDMVDKVKVDTHETNQQILLQIEGNREILKENHQTLLQHNDVLKDHEEGLGLIVEKIEDFDIKHKENDENIDQIQKDLKAHEARLDILKEDYMDQKSALNKVNDDLKNQEESLNLKIVETNERIEKEEKKVEEIIEKLILDEKSIEKIQENVKKIDEELNGNNANMYEMDDKFSKYIENIYLEMESRNYLNDLYNQIQAEQDSQTETYLRSKINKTSYQITKIMEKIDESDKIFDQFEIKTDNNFQIAEKAIKAHTKFLNEIDARLTIEELYNKVCHRGVEENMRKSIGILTQQIENLSLQQTENQHGKVETIKEIRELEEKTLEMIEEKNRENQAKFQELQDKSKILFNALKSHGNFLNELDAKMMAESLMTIATQDELERKLNKEVNDINEEIKVLAQQNLADLEDKMNQLHKKIEEDTIPHTILQMDETMKKLNNKAQSLNEELARRTKALEEQVAEQIKATNGLHGNQRDLEATVVLNSTIQKASEKNLMDYCREGFEKTRKVLKELENVTFDQKVEDDNDGLYEDIQLLLNKINELQKEINEIRDSTESTDKKAVTSHINDIEKRLDKKASENNSRVLGILEKLQEEFDKLKSKMHVNT